MSYTCGMVSLGCPKNQVDAEHLLFDLKEAGFKTESDVSKCDAVIINTCAFIDDAKQEAIDTVLEFAELKKAGKIKVIAITGCLSERYREEVVKEFPEVDIVLGIGSNKKLAEAIYDALKGKKTASFGEKCDLPLEGGRIISNLPFFAYVKIAEGCDNRCAYCAIPAIRGKFRSRPMENIIDEVKNLAAGGISEIILVAQDTTLYGVDIYKKKMLPELLEKLCGICGIKWIRFLYAYPDKVTDELINVVASQPKIVKYFDIPLQHVSKTVLRRMHRPGNAAEYLALIEKIRREIPGVALRTTFMTGFPGETEKDFEELCEFVDKVKFERMGCFAFSPEEDTAAAVMEDQIDDGIKRHRCDILMEKQMMIMDRDNEHRIGNTVEVVVEGFDEYSGCFYGRSATDAPDIDSGIYFTSEKELSVGEYVNVLINDRMDYDLLGEATRL